MRPVAQAQQMNERAGELEKEKRELRDEVAQQKRSLEALQTRAAESAQKQKQQAQQIAQLEEQLGAYLCTTTNVV